MKQSQKDRFRSKFMPSVCRAVFYGNATEAHLVLPWLQIKRGSAMSGSGESTKFGSSLLARLDGKQVERRTSFGHELDASPEAFGFTSYVEICDCGREGKLYAITG